ncbi:Carbon monoxide dehydrogenase subunit G [Sinosporangium album]|uniref:Carbon monoxide dehydrogenase subunit G n=1 Tax=Sinosporangium album TaxID=504805 RepID=A0A1G8CYX4_9ACTN|nr:SRPBCC family protein [Sinosporangium album]SDH50413.1 Carbon monoxide dehydrogenase subunit G [Sinosporangium album]
MVMRFEHEFSVPVPVEQAWSVLLDVERVAPCLPGATLDSVEGNDFTGRIKVRVGPITVTYRGEASIQDIDKDAHALTIKAVGKESRGSGTAAATVTARLHSEGDHTKVTVETGFNITGRPAQFGRGVMAEVGGKLIDRFAANLSALLAGPAPEPESEAEPGAKTAEPRTAALAAAAPTAPEVPDTAHGAELADDTERPHLITVPPTPRPAEPSRPAGTVRTPRSPEEEALDLLEVAGAPLLKRAAPVFVGFAVILTLIWAVRRLLGRRD